MTITQKELYDENKKPVLKEGEALTNGRMFPLEDGETGEGIGLTEKVFFCLHYWAQENQGVMIELGCPGNDKKK